MPLGNPNPSPLFPTMLAAATAQTGGSATFVAFNGMFPANPPAPSIHTNPGPLLPISSNIGPPNLITGQTLATGQFILPPNFGPNPANLTCTVPFSAPPHLQTPMLPFMGSNTANPLSIPAGFGTPMPQLLQPSLNTAFPSVSSGLNSPSILPGSLFPSSGPLPMTSVPSTILSSQPMVVPAIPLPFNTLNSGSTNTMLPISMGIPQAPMPSGSTSESVTNVCQSLASTCGSTPVYTATLFPVGNPNPVLPVSASPNITTNLTPTSDSVLSGDEPGDVNSIAPSVKAERPSSTISSASSRNNSLGNLLALEAADFHRDAILDAIDKLRERKARPDFERISCLLKRYQNINPDQTQLCLGRLADAGAVVCVDYKGNLSYRNPSKWRKTAATSGSGTTNLPSVSHRLVEAVKRLMDATASNQSSGPPAPLSLATFAQPGPNGGYSLFQIERSLQFAAGTEAVNSFSSKTVPELTGATLRVCLDREATHGKLAKTPDGRYILDEFGERKRSSPNMGLPPLPQLSNKRPLPPHTFSGVYLATVGAPPKVAKPAVTGASGAPTIDYTLLTSRLHPLAAKQTPTISIAPNVNGRSLPVSPLSTISTRPLGSGRRGRPPGSKSKKSSTSENSSDKVCILIISILLLLIFKVV